LHKIRGWQVQGTDIDVDEELGSHSSPIQHECGVRAESLMRLDGVSLEDAMAEYVALIDSRKA